MTTAKFNILTPTLKAVKVRHTFMIWARKGEFDLTTHQDVYDSYGFHPFMNDDTQMAWVGWFSGQNQNGELEGV
jgi:hypothetical protein